MSYLVFKLTGDTGKTLRYDVLSEQHGWRLGRIAWFGRWRQYVFRPVDETIFNRDCLQEINDFLASLMRDRKNRIDRQDHA